MEQSKEIQYLYALSSAEVYWGKRAEELLNEYDDINNSCVNVNNSKIDNIKQLLLEKSNYRPSSSEKTKLSLTALPFISVIKILSIVPVYMLIFVTMFYLPLQFFKQQNSEYNIVLLQEENLPFIVTSEILNQNNILPPPTLSRPKAPTFMSVTPK